MQRTRWTERRFHLDLPPGWMPNVLERLRGTHPRLLVLATGLNEERATEQANGAWSIKQHIGHLSDLEALHTGRIDDFLAGAEVLRAADMQNRATEQADHSARSLAELIDRFAAQREDFIQRLGSLDDATCSRAILHPRLQVPMRPVDMAYFTAEHDDHHLASMRTLVGTTK
ncbi:MAG: DinB family protein [Flavobacteriales bacterium]|nr:DinB family protein [Flavobacteriales bacterium]